MRPFENIFLLLLTTLSIAFILLIKQPAEKRKRPLLLLLTLSWFTMIIQIAFEQYRWQMLPAYLLLLAHSALFLYTQQKNNPFFASILWKIPLLLTLLLTLFLPAAFPVPLLLAPTGPYPVGTEIFYFSDPSRPEIYTSDTTDNRELMVQIWYPTTDPVPAETAPYLDALDVAAPAIAARLDFPSFLLNHAALVKTHSYKNAPLAPDVELPVLHFSHGWLGIRTQNSFQMEELASHGYLVIATDHTYGNVLSVFPDGRTIFHSPDIFPNGLNPQDGNGVAKVWAADIGFVLDQITLMNDEPTNRFYQRLNLNQIGIWGHSTGGGATLEFCHEDSRCQAALLLDGWMEIISQNQTEWINSPPTMFISTPRWLGDKNRPIGEKFYDETNNDAYLLTIAETDHYNFSDIPLISPLLPYLKVTGKIDGRYGQLLINEQSLRFFDNYLKGNNASPLQYDSLPPSLTVRSHQ